MKTFELILMTLHANEELEAEEGGKASKLPIGRTAIHKLTYFATQKIKCDTSYYAHYFGPFSKDVAEGISTLWAFGYVLEKEPDSTCPGYTYTLNSGGKRLGKRLADDDYKKEYEDIRSIVKTCRRKYKLQQAYLAYAAKIHYIVKKGDAGYGDTGKLIKIAHKLGWKLYKKNITSGLGLLQALELAR